MYSIAIDGPAGAGKSTIAKTIAKKLEFYLCGYGSHVPGHGFVFYPQPDRLYR